MKCSESELKWIRTNDIYEGCILESLQQELCKNYKI